PIIAVAFFVMLFWAALTSAISLLEVVVSYFIDRRGWSRAKATVMMGGTIYGLGILSAISAIKLPFRGEDTGFLLIFDYITTNYMLPLGGLLTCLFAAWVMNDLTRREEFGSSGLWYKALIVALKFVTPLAVLITLLHGLELLPFMDY
ncbi:MAG: sodium-dependent transporter, partial [bacterium]|nr:sodium-dependent transporter [bacterium]